MPSLEEGGAMPRAHAGDDEDTGAWLKAWVRADAERAKLWAQAAEKQAEATAALAAEVKELRGDVQRLAPSPRLVMAAFGTIVAAGVAIIAFLIGGVLMLRGLDPRVAAEAAREVVETVQPVTVNDTDVGED
jgi:hypothetical protein